MNRSYTHVRLSEALRRVYATGLDDHTLRCFVFVHRNISNEQKAVQAAHAVANLFRIEDNTPAELKTARLWEQDTRTLILLDGGDCEQLGKIRNNVVSYSLVRGSDPDVSATEGFAFGTFTEDGITLPKMLTAVAVVVDNYAVQAWRNCLNDKDAGEAMDHQENFWFSLLHQLATAKLMKM